MAGFLGLFGKKTKYIDEADDATQLQNSQDNLDDFFLSPDDAKTLGNTDWMRASNSAPSSQNGQGVRENSNNGTSSSASGRDDSNMDLWRKMARDMKR